MSIDNEMIPEVAREIFVGEKAREVVAAFGLDEALGASKKDFDDHLDTIGGYLDTMVFPSMSVDFETTYHPTVPDVSAFYEAFRQKLIKELEGLRSDDSSKAVKRNLETLIQEIRDFEISLPTV